MDGLRFGLSIESNIANVAAGDAATLGKFSVALTQAKNELAQYNKQLALAKELGDIGGKQRYEALRRGALERVSALGAAFDSVGGGAMGFRESQRQELARQRREQRERHEQEIEGRERAKVINRSVSEVSRGGINLAKALGEGNVVGAVHGATEALGGLANTLDLIAPGLGEAARAAIEFGGAFAEMAIEAVKGATETALHVTAMNRELKATFDALGAQGPQSGDATIAMLNSLNRTLPQSREKLADWTKNFEALGFTDLGQLRYQVQATASAQAVMGDAGAEAYEHLSRKIRLAVEAGHGLKLAERPLEQIYKMGTNATDVATRLGLSVKQLKQQLEAGTINAQAFGNALSASLIDRGAGPLEAMASDIDVIGEKGKEVFRQMFADVDTTPLTDAIRMVVELGDQGEPAGRALKSGLTGAINAVIRALGEMTIEGTVFFLHIEAGAIRLYHRVQPVIGALEKIGLWLDEHSALLEKLGIGGATGAAKLAATSVLGPVGGQLVGGALDLLGLATAPGGAPLKQHERRGAQALSFLDFAPRDSIAPYSRRDVRQFAAPQHIDRSVHIGQVNVTAPEGVTDAHKLSVTTLGTALERAQLASGR